MLSIGIVVGLLGYGLVFYGSQLWSGCTQNSFLDIMWPGGQHFKPCPPQSGGGSSGNGGQPNPLGLTSKQKRAYRTAATGPGTPHR